MKNLSFLLFSILLLFSACIGDDFIDDEVDPILRITSSVDTIAFGTTFQFTARYLNNVGIEEIVPKVWTSTDESLITIDNNGLATAIAAGQVTIGVEVDVNGAILRDEAVVNIGEETVVIPTERTGTLEASSFYDLEGDFSLSEENGTLILRFADNYVADTSLPGLYIYLTNNPNTINGALEIGRVIDFSGAHEYEIPAGSTLNEYQYVLYFCKPFNVKVGDGEFDN